MTSSDVTERAVMSAPTVAPEAPAGRSTGWWAMVLFIATEAATFAVFLASYFYIQFSSRGSWPPPADKEPALLLPTIGTAVLVVSTLPMLLGARRAGSGSRAGAALGTTGALAGGIGFLVVQVLDWRAEWPTSTLSKDAYGSLFYGITGLHAVHVLVGLGMLGFLLASLAVRTAATRPHGPVSLVAIYWYFMAVVALAVYVVVYLSPTL